MSSFLKRKQRIYIIFFLVIPAFILGIMAYLLRESCADITDISIPPEYGTITETYIGSSDTVLFLIGDVHDNYQAQQSIASIIDVLANYYDIPIVALEGCSGLVDTAELSQYYNVSVKQRVCSYYMKKGYWGGATYSALITPTEYSVHGVEDRALYTQHYTRYVDSITDRRTALEHIERLQVVLNRFKEKIYPPELLTMEQTRTDYNNDVISLIDYCHSIVRLASGLQLAVRGYPNMAHIKEMIRIEDAVDFTRIDREQEELLRLMRKKIGKNLDDLSLFEKTVAEFKEKQIDESKYYDVISLLSDKYQVSINAFANVAGVMKSVRLAEKIDPLQLLAEAQELYPLIQNMFLQTSQHDIVKELIEHIADLGILRGIVSFTASHEEVEDYLDHSERFRTAKFITFIRTYAHMYDVSYRIHPKIVIIDRIRPVLEHLYTVSDQRSAMLVTNTLDSIKQETAMSAILVVGSFHIPYIQQILQEQDISYVSITPRVDRVRGDIPITDILIGSNPLFYRMPSAFHLKPWVALCPINGGTDVYFRRLVKVEFVAEDLYTRIFALSKKVSEKTVTRGMYLLQQELENNANADFPEPLQVLKLGELDKHLIQVKIAETDSEVLVEPIMERDQSYAAHKIASVKPLHAEQFERGIFKSNNRLISELHKDFNVEDYQFREKYLKEIKKELTEKAERMAPVMAPPIAKVPEQETEAVSALEEANEQAVAMRINSIAAIEEKLTEVETLTGLNNLDNQFVILKSQLSFYTVTKKEKEYIKHVERRLHYHIDKVLRELEEQERQLEAERQRVLQDTRLEKELKDAQERKKKRKKIDLVIEKIDSLKQEVDMADSLQRLSEIEDTFNELIAPVSLADLTEEDRVILGAFKMSWENQWAAVEGQISEEQRKRSSEEEGLLQDALAQARSLKELVDFASLPVDAEFILQEYEKTLSGVDLTSLSNDEKFIFERIGTYINKKLQDLKQGVRTEPVSLLNTVPVKRSLFTRLQPPTSSVEQLFAGVYTLRSKALMAKNLKEAQACEEDFNSIDQQLRTFELDSQQKAILADTERIIKESMRRAIISAEQELEIDRRKEEQRIRVEKDELIRELLGEDLVLVEPSKKQVLVIENNPFEKNILHERLRKEGYGVSGFDDYAIPITYFMNNPINLILLDDDIIGYKSGLDFVADLKAAANQRNFTLPLIVIHTNNSISWTHNLLKRKGLHKDPRILIISKRNLDQNITFIRSLVEQA